MPEPASDTITFLFTSIVGAAKRWEQQPAAMSAAMTDLDGAVREAARQYNGLVFQVVNNDYCIAFTEEAAAVNAAMMVQQRVAAQSEAVSDVKMAIHCGPAEQRGDSYFAPLVFNRLSRILAAAHRGQIIVSAATHAALDNLPANLSLRDMGEHHLRDVGVEHLYQLTAPHIADHFPPLRTLEARLHNLPAQATSFVGREEERNAVRRLLRQPDVRLVTLTGVGGSGKTRLCLEVAADLLDEFADGVFFVPLAAINSPHLVATAVAETFGLREGGSTAIATLLSEYLAPKQMLLVLDNFEQIVAAAPLLDDLLAAAPLLKLLVSSRELLHLRREHEYNVPLLPIPNLQQLPSTAELADYTAIALFVTRAQASHHDFTLADDNAAVVAKICVRLDGLPLALELAAARVRDFTLEQILAGLDDRFALLQRDYRDLIPRHRSLRGAIDWSYNLLSEGEQLLFSRLSVFVSGCAVAAVQAVCNADHDLPFSETVGMSLLVDKNLVQLASSEEGDGRYLMLETIREYAHQRLNEHRYNMAQKSLREYAGEQLAVSGEEATILERHARYYLALGEQASPKLRGAEQEVWLNRLAQDHDNLRAALSWGLTHHRALAVSIAVAVWRFWLIRGYLSEGRYWLELALADGAEGIDPLVWAKALNAAGGLARMQGDLEVSRQLHEQALQLHRAIGDQAAIAAATYSLANVLRGQNEIQLARSLYEETAKICEQVDDKPILIAAYGNLGELALAEGDVATARPIMEANLARAHALGDPQIISQATDDMARLLYEEGDYLAAEGYLAEGTAIARRIGFIWGLGHGLSLWAKIKTLLGDDDAARTILKEVVTMRQQIEAKPGLAYALNELTIIAVRHHTVNIERAVAVFAAVATMLASIDAEVEPIQRDGYAQALATCHAALSEDEFAAAWAAGETMSMAQAIDYALASLA